MGIEIECCCFFLSLVKTADHAFKMNWKITVFCLSISSLDLPVKGEGVNSRNNSVFGSWIGFLHRNQVK